MNSVLLAIYILGVIAVALWIMSVAAHEPTSHGQGVIFTYGCLAIFLWPLVVVYALIFGAFLFGRSAVRLIRRWLR